MARKMAKKKAPKAKLVKRNTALAREGEAEAPELLATIDCDGEILNIERRFITEMHFPPACIAGSDQLPKERMATLVLKMEAIRFALKSKSKDVQDEAIDTMLGDLAIGAYQDKLIVYRELPTGPSKNSLDALKGIQKIRQAADTHLLNVIRAIRDIKRPPVNVVVKEAEQVNVAEQQINVGKHPASASGDKEPA